MDQAQQLVENSILNNPGFLHTFRALISQVPTEIDIPRGPHDATKRSFHSAFGGNHNDRYDHASTTTPTPLQPTTIVNPYVITTTTMNDGEEQPLGMDGGNGEEDQGQNESTGETSSSDDDNDSGSENDSSDDDDAFPTGHSDPLSPQRMAEMDQLHQTMQAAFGLSHQIDNEVDHIHSTISTLYARSYPQLTKHLPRAKDYVRVLSILLGVNDNGKGNQVGVKAEVGTFAMATTDGTVVEFTPPQTLSHTQQQQIATLFGQQIAHIITMEFHTIQHAAVTTKEYIIIKTGINQILSLLKYTTQLTPVFAHCAKSLAPNLSALLSPSIAAQFIVLANGLTQLASLSPQSLTSFGASKQAGQKKAAAGGFGGAAASKMGIILEVPIIKSLEQSDQKKRQRGLRLVCRKTILAARADCQSISPQGLYGIKLREEIEKKLTIFQHINPYKRVKALRIPGQREYSRKVSKKIRDKLKPSQLSKNANMVRFGYDDGPNAGVQQGELYDEFTGTSYGLVGNPTGGPVAVQQQKELVLSRLPARIRYRLEHYKQINSLIANAYPYLFGLKQTQLVAHEDEVEMGRDLGEGKKVGGGIGSVSSASSSSSSSTSIKPTIAQVLMMTGPNTSASNSNNTNGATKDYARSLVTNQLPFQSHRNLPTRQVPSENQGLL